MVILTLVQNIAFLVALVTVNAMIIQRWKRRVWLVQWLSGILFGAIAMLGMMTPLKLAPGVIYDGRSIILGIAGLFGGPLTAAISCLMAVAYRIYLGGSGVWAGSFVAFEAALTGVVFSYLRRRFNWRLSAISLYGFGLAIHIFMLLAQKYMLPPATAAIVLPQITFPVLAIYPLATVLVGLIFLEQEQRLALDISLRENRETLLFTLNAAQMGVWEVDLSNNQVTRNEDHDRIFGYPEMQPGWKIGDTYRHIVPEQQEQVKAIYNQALKEKKRVEFETQIIREDGRRRWIWVNGELRGNGIGNNRRMAGVIQDITERKEMVEQLRESYERYRLLADNTADVIWLLDVNTFRFSYVSPSVEKLRGFTPDEVMNEPMSSALTPESIQKVREMYAAQMNAFKQGDRSQLTRTLELDQPHKDGRIIPTEVVTTVLMDETGKPKGVLGVSRDITERKRHQQELLDRESRLRAFMEHFPGLAVIQDEECKVIYANQIVRALTQLSQDQISGKVMKDLFPQGLTEAIAQMDDEVLKEQSVVQREIPNPGNPERTLLRIGFPIPQSDGKLMMGALGLDITEQKKAERERQVALAKYQTLFELFPLGITVSDPDGKIIEGNRMAERLLELPQEEHIRRSVDDQVWKIVRRDGSVMPPDEFASVRALRERRLVENVEMGVFKPNGDKVWLSVNAAPLPVEGYGVVITYGDIGDRVKAQEEIERLNADLERRVKERTAALEMINQELEAFTYSVSHDLRAPLRAMDGYSKILQDDFGELINAEGKHYLRRIRESAQFMGMLIDSLLKLSRLSRVPLNMHPLDLELLARKAWADLASECEQRTCELKIGELPQAIGDSTLIYQVLVNLLSNALKFTRTRELTLIEIGAQSDPESGKPIYYVRDNGIGFDMRYRDKLFGVFQRLESNVNLEGTGVGLAIVRRIIQRHGGQVWAEGEPDCGAVFYFTIGSGNDRPGE